MKRILEKLNAPRLIYIDGRDLLPGGRRLAGDVTHPSALGIKTITEKLSAVMKQKFADA